MRQREALLASWQRDHSSLRYVLAHQTASLIELVTPLASADDMVLPRRAKGSLRRKGSCSCSGECAA